MVSQTQSMQQAYVLTDGMPTSMSLVSVQALYGVILSNRLEFFMFFSAVLGYLILSWVRLPKRSACHKSEKLDAPSTMEQSTSEVADIAGVKSTGSDGPFDQAPTDQQTCENALKMYATAKDYAEVQRFVDEMTASKIPLSARATFFVMKAALQAQNFPETMKYLRHFKDCWQESNTSESLMPQVVMLALVDLAAKEQEMGKLVRELAGMPLPEKTVDAMLSKCVEPPDAETAKCVESFARAQRAKLSDSTLSLLIKATAARPLRMRGIVEEVMQRTHSDFSPDLALAVLGSCKSGSDAAIVNSLFQRMKPKQPNVLAAFIWFYIGVEQFDKACDIYELDMQVLSRHAGGSITLDASLQESIVDAAVLCGRTHLAESVMSQIAQAKAFESAGCFQMLRRSTSCLQELFGATVASVARWNEVISYWVVLIF